MRFLIACLLITFSVTAQADIVHRIDKRETEEHQTNVFDHKETLDHLTRPPEMFDTKEWSASFIDHLWLKGLYSYSFTGHVPDTKIWKYLEWREELDPSRFFHYHPYFEGMFTPAECVGLLPIGPYWTRMEERYDLNPIQFIKHHPALEIPLERNAKAESQPSCNMGTVPEPSTFVLLSIAIVGAISFMGFFRWGLSKWRC